MHVGQFWCGVLNLTWTKLVWFQSKAYFKWLNYCFSVTEPNFYVSSRSLRGRGENVEERVKRGSVYEEGLNVCKDGGGWGRRGHIQRGRRRVAGEGGGAVTRRRGQDTRKGLSEWTAREETLARRRGVEMCERKNECVWLRLKTTDFCERGGIVPLGQSGQTRGGSHAEHHGYVSNNCIYYTL